MKSVTMDNDGHEEERIYRRTTPNPHNLARRLGKFGVATDGGAWTQTPQNILIGVFSGNTWYFCTSLQKPRA
jgi:hypothetical protein